MLFRTVTCVYVRVVDRYPQNAWKTAAATPLTELKVYLTKYQNPETADTITKVQKDLDETKEVLVGLG